MNKRLIRRLAVLLALSMLLAVRFIGERFSPPEKASHEEQRSSGREYFRVIRVHDGDTVTAMIAGKTEKIRLVGIDAPEIGQRSWGQKAKRHIEEILDSSDRSVSLEYDIETRDRYGRLLAYLWTKDGKMLNRTMIEDGYALLLTVPPNVMHVEEFKVSQESARRSKSGIWGSDGLREKPSDYRKRGRGR
ncbi:MAG: thermonuclease family protein [Thermodesulfovibrionales bacterium]|nr:thermonuclease family protein [Thermodesulfovibrionales bacterium]